MIICLGLWGSTGEQEGERGNILNSSLWEKEQY